MWAQYTGSRSLWQPVASEIFIPKILKVTLKYNLIFLPINNNREVRSHILDYDRLHGVCLHSGQRHLYFLVLWHNQAVEAEQAPGVYPVFEQTEVTDPPEDHVWEFHLVTE